MSGVRMALWRDRDPAAMRIPGVYAGSVELAEDPLDAVARLAAGGVRFARLPDMVDLDDADGSDAVAALVVVRELTSHGIAVDWTLRLPDRSPDWRPLSHLHPPTAVLCNDDDDIATAWRDSFHIAKCGYRHGPGFIEVRDHRTDSFRRLVIRNPQHDQVIQPLLRGVPATDLAEAATARYQRAGLLHRAGRYLWWTPYRIRRWPLSTTVP
jgi:hypothetical protein